MKAQIVDGPFRKADYPIFPTLVQVHKIDIEQSELTFIEGYDELTEWPEDVGVGKTSSQKGLHFIDDSKLVTLRRTIEERVKEYTATVGLGDVEIGMSWINKQSKQGYVAPHRHQLSVVSGAYYPICEPDSAPLVFGSPILGPRMAEIHNKATEFTADNMEFTPQPGMLILFPSWLYHHSLPNKTDKRVTISFNTYHKST
jgi:uncharacterized protein (TIGR02466 family)